MHSLEGAVIRALDHLQTLHTRHPHPCRLAAATAAAAGTTLKCSGLSETDKKNRNFANCVDSEASAAAVLKKVGGAAKAPIYVKTDGKDIKSKDVACNGKAFCEVGRASALHIVLQWQRIGRCLACAWFYDVAQER
jgi:hypothetical protein